MDIQLVSHFRQPNTAASTRPLLRTPGTPRGLWHTRLQLPQGFQAACHSGRAQLAQRWWEQPRPHIPNARVSASAPATEVSAPSRDTQLLPGAAGPLLWACRSGDHCSLQRQLFVDEQPPLHDSPPSLRAPTHHTSVLYKRSAGAADVQSGLRSSASRTFQNNGWQQWNDTTPRHSRTRPGLVSGARRGQKTVSLCAHVTFRQLLLQLRQVAQVGSHDGQSVRVQHVSICKRKQRPLSRTETGRHEVQGRGFCSDIAALPPF